MMAARALPWFGRALRRALRACVPLRLRVRVSAWRQRGKLVLGKGAHLERGVQILGRAQVRIGANCCIGAHSWLNVNQRIAGELAIVIGDNCFIGRDNFFSSGRAITIGDYCLTTVGCRFIGSSHVIDDPAHPVISSGTTACDGIDVGANCFFGVGATVMGNVTIGHGSVIGAGTLVLSDVPCFSLVVGSPGRIVKRYSVRRKAWIALALLQDDDLLDNPEAGPYLAQLRAQFPRVDMPWIAGGPDMGSF